MSSLPHRGRRPKVLALAALATAADLAFERAVRRRIEGWGVTDEEHRATWPGDELVPRPGFVWTNAVTVHRPAEDVWPWLAQLGQGRGGLYSYDWLENLIGCDVHSSDRILARCQQPLPVGSREIRMARYAPSNPVARYEPGRALVLGHVHDSDDDLAAGRSRGTWAFLVHPVDRDTTRLLVRSRGNSRAGRLAGPIQFIMQRKTMQGVKQRAEGTRPVPAADVAEPLLWLTAAAMLAAAATRVLVQPERWGRPYAVAAGAAAALPWLLFWQPPLAVGAAVDGLLVGGLLRSR